MDKRVVLFCALIAIVFADDRVHFNEEHERRWNTPPELTPEQIERKSNPKNGQAQARLFPLAASFSLSAGQSNAHSLSVGASEDGISLSQSSSLANSGASQFGNSGLSASQSTSFSAGLGGISTADSNSFSLNHPVFGGNSQANSNSFSLGQANAAAQGSALNGQATSGAQSSVGSAHSAASSGASSNSGNGQFSSGDALILHGRRPNGPHWTNLRPNYEHQGSRRPMLTISQTPDHWSEGSRPIRPITLEIDVEDGGWTNQPPEIHISKWHPGHGEYPGQNRNPWRNTGCQNSGRPCRNHGSFVPAQGHRQDTGGWFQGQNIDTRPNGNGGQNILVNAASASSSSSSGTNGFSVAQSNSQSQSGQRGPASSTNNFVQTSGNAQGHAQGSAASVQQGFGGSSQGSFASGAISGSSLGHGQSLGSAISGNRGENSRGQVNAQTVGSGFIQGSANAGSVSFVRFPGEGQGQDIPRDFVRSKVTARNDQKKKNHPVDDFLTDLTDAVVEVLDFS